MMLTLPSLDVRIPHKLVPQASRRRGAAFARTLLRAGVVEAALLPVRPSADHIKTCQSVLEGWIRRELGGLRMLRPYFSLHLRDASADAGRVQQPACVVEWGAESFGVRMVGPALECLERHRPRLGVTVLRALERCAWRTLPIYTPAVVMECASDTYWYGEFDEEMAIEEACGDDAAERESMRQGMVTRAMFDAVFPAWALGGRTKSLGRRTLRQLAEAAVDPRIRGVIECVLRMLDLKLPEYDWSMREGRFVGFSGVLAWGPNDDLTTRVLDDYEQMVSESGDYFEPCGEDALGAGDHDALAGWFAYLRKWCAGVNALDDLTSRLTDGNWTTQMRGGR